MHSLPAPRGRARAPLRGRRRARAAQRAAPARRHPPPLRHRVRHRHARLSLPRQSRPRRRLPQAAASTSASPAAPSPCRLRCSTSPTPSCSTGMRRRCSGGECNLGLVIVILVRRGDSGYARGRMNRTDEHDGGELELDLLAFPLTPGTLMSMLPVVRALARTDGVFLGRS